MQSERTLEGGQSTECNNNGLDHPYDHNGRSEGEKTLHAAAGALPTKHGGSVLPKKRGEGAEDVHMSERETEDASAQQTEGLGTGVQVSGVQYATATTESTDTGGHFPDYDNVDVIEPEPKKDAAQQAQVRLKQQKDWVRTLEPVAEHTGRLSCGSDAGTRISDGDRHQDATETSSDKNASEPTDFAFHSDEDSEMQVVVNSLTPVLQRRKPVRKSHSHTGSSGQVETKVDLETLQALLGDEFSEADFNNNADNQNSDGNTLKKIPKTLEGERSQASEKGVRGQKSQASGVRERRSQASEKELGLDGQAPSVGDAGSLFIKPKFARTWHGPVTASRSTAPRMGVGMVAPDPSSSAFGQGSYVSTMPLISRTLLDALHKRYCSYQYPSEWGLPPSKPPDPNAGPPLSIPPQLMGARLKMLNSDGESDTGSSAAGSSQSSPRVAHSTGGGASAAAASGGDETTPESSPQSEKKLPERSRAEMEAEIEAVEACQWLRAAGFPQYAQMFEDGLFPVDISDVKRDHDFLDPDSIQSLFRRLNILNQCAVMKIDAQPRRKAIEESDEEDLCALSDRWEYQKNVRRWSRKGPELGIDSDATTTANTTTTTSNNNNNSTTSSLQPSSSHDSLLAGQDSGSHTDESPVLESKMPHAVQVARNVDYSQHTQQTCPPPQQPPVVSFSEGQAPNHNSSSFPISPKLRRAASERLKSALKKMESFKKKSKKYPTVRNIREISGPVIADQAGMHAKIEHLHCVDLSPTGSTPAAKISPDRESTPKETGQKVPQVHYDRELSVSPVLPASPISSAPEQLRENHSAPTPADLSLSEYYTAHSQLLASFQSYSGVASPVRKNNSDTNLKEIFLLPQDHKPGSFPRRLHNGYIDITMSPTLPPAAASPPGTIARVPQTTTVQHGAKHGNSRVSVYDNLPGALTTPPGNARPFLNRSLSGTKVMRSHSISSGDSASSKEKQEDCALAQEPPAAMPKAWLQEALGQDTQGLGQEVRSRSFSATTSTDHQEVPAFPTHKRDPSEGYHTWNSSKTQREKENEGETQASLDEFDFILQGLYREIGNLNRAINHEHSAAGGDSFGFKTGDSVSLNSGDNTAGDSVSVKSGDTLGGRSSFAGMDGGGYCEIDLICESVKVDSNTSTAAVKPTDLSLSDRVPVTKPYTIQHTEDGYAIVQKVRNKVTVVETIDHTSPLTDDAGLEMSEDTIDDSAEGELDEEEQGSQTASSHTSSDQDDGEFSPDGTLEKAALRERRDSGVGSSLTRASSERKQKKLRWHSFQKCHRPSVGSRELQIGGLSVCQLLPLRQLSLLKLTAIMEKCSPTSRSQWSWSVPRFMKRNKVPQFSDKNVFGVPFTVMLQRTGQPLPQCVLYAMRYLRKTSHDALGIFRKSGVRSRIQKLRDLVEANPDAICFDELQPYDVADLLKQYFRELPECLLTTKLSDTFRSIFTHVPVSQRLEALQTAVILLPEENLEVLHCLLLFLSDIAQHADKHQMNASNLAVCFAPSLFNLNTGLGSGSPRRQRKSPGVPDQRELLEQKAVHECFTFMITNCKKLFMVPTSMYSRLHLSTLSNMEPVHLDEFYAYSKQPGPDYRAFGEEHIQILLKEAHDKNRGWNPVTVSVPGIEVSQRKPQDGHPLRQWKCSVEIEAPPIEVLNRILHERHTWDDDLLSWCVVERLDRHADVFHYVLNSMAPHPPRHFTVIRYWRPDLVKGSCAIVSRSVVHPNVQSASEMIEDGVHAVELGSYYLMEPCGSGRSRLTYIARTDLRGRCPDWYNRVFGHLCANFVDRLRDSFRQEADGPETKV